MKTKIDKDIVRRNVKKRLTAMDLHLSELAELADLSRTIIYKRMKDLRPRDIAWLADLLVIPEGALISINPTPAASIPVPPPNWLKRIRKYLGKGLAFEDLQRAAFGLWLSME